MRKVVANLLVVISLIAFAGCQRGSYQQDIEHTNFSTNNTDQCKHFEFTVECERVAIDEVLIDSPIIVIPETINGLSVVEIGDSAFYQKECTEIHLPGTIRTIRADAFYRCHNLKNITIPSSTVHIEGNPFFRCSSLVNIYVNQSNMSYCDIDGVLYNSEKNALIAYPEGRNESTYVIPDGVTTICDTAFGYSSQLERVIIPESVTNFPDYNLFELCEGICFVVAPGSVAEQYAIEFGIQTEIRVSA